MSYYKTLIIALISGFSLLGLHFPKQDAGIELKPISELRNIELHRGSGSFLVSDGRDSTKMIQVHYHMPKNFTADSKILMVIPGAGRNADDYRDAWITNSEKYNVLVLSPSFPDQDYNFEAYHLGGLIQSSNLMDNVTYINGTNKATLDEQNYHYKIKHNPDQWIYPQFDRIFELVKSELESNREKYDLFGHSAGGHILHRMGIFYSSNKMNRILASNASFYTLPSLEYKYPFGISNLTELNIDLKHAFQKDLVVFLGEEDNHKETRGTFLISESANQQGAHRLERGRFFFQTSEEIASDMDLEFNWQIVTIPGIGHNYREMSKAAAKYLYSNSNLK